MVREFLSTNQNSRFILGQVLYQEQTATDQFVGMGDERFARLLEKYDIQLQFLNRLERSCYFYIFLDKGLSKKGFGNFQISIRAFVQ